MGKTITLLPFRGPLRGPIILLLLLTACNTTPQKNTKSTHLYIPIFIPDSAYSFVVKQLEFGPRVPNTDAHLNCGNWLVEKCREFGAEVIEQTAVVTAFDGTPLNMRNIIAQYQPEKKNRILLMAHWDSRPFADHDPDSTHWDTPIQGANDGASGVGVLLEIARNLKTTATPLGIDILFFDAEDYGVPEHSEIEWKADTWCLGSQYWSNNLHTDRYFARFGILLDMVGAKNAQFTQEEVSRYYAKSVVDKVWKKAHELGFGSYFPYTETQQIVDDHRYVNELTGIPSIDILQYDNTTESNFGAYWHTQNDNLSVINKETLEAVGKTLLAVIYKETI